MMTREQIVDRISELLIEKYTEIEGDSYKAIIINGRFQVKNNNFHVEYEVYDMESWKQLVKRTYFCTLHDVQCIYNAFIISMENNISPFLVDRLDVESTILALEKAEKENQSDQLNKNKKINETEIEIDYYDFLEDKNYREFNLKDINPQTLKQNNSLQDLSKILLQVFSSPYEVFIGDLLIENHEVDIDKYKIKLPIRYSMMNILQQELLSSLPLNSYLNTDEEVIFQFSNNDFIIDDYFKENMVKNKFQKFPVIYFMDKVGKPKFIAIDSWIRQDLFGNIMIDGLPVYFINKFRPLFSITSGFENIELAINTKTLDLEYDFIIPNETLEDYVKVVVKFMQRDEIEKLSEK